jgi:hypothetical protein
LDLKPGLVYGVSNGRFGTWEKVDLGVQLSEGCLTRFDQISEEKIDGNFILFIYRNIENADAPDNDILTNFSKTCIETVLMDRQKSYPWKVTATGYPFLFDWKCSSIFVDFLKSDF